MPRPPRTDNPTHKQLYLGAACRNFLDDLAGWLAGGGKPLTAGRVVELAVAEAFAAKRAGRRPWPVAAERMAVGKGKGLPGGRGRIKHMVLAGETVAQIQALIAGPVDTESGAVRACIAALHAREAKRPGRTSAATEVE